jgi:hypothetical protein
MNRTNHFPRRLVPAGCLSINNRWLPASLFLFVVCLALRFQVAQAADNYYINNAILDYPALQPYPPVVDATNFINNSSFTVNFTPLTLPNQLLYETSDTYNYTNNGSMIANSGFRFDTQLSASGARIPAASFYNPGLVSCGSAADLEDPFLGELATFGNDQCVVLATNIANPGEVDTGVGGLIDFKGQNIDLSQGFLNIEGGAAFTGVDEFNLNPFPWDPSANLGVNFALTPPFATPPGQLFLVNSVAYTNLASIDTNNNILRSVFIEDTSDPNVSYSIYFGGAPAAGLGGGDVTIAWAGTYVDTATGFTYTNYLYLNDNYQRGASTNVILGAGIPDNFVFTQSPVPLLAGPGTAPAGSVSFPAGGITNYYDLVNAQIGVASTNNIPNHSITNLPGRVQINGGKYVDLSLCQISGPAYLSVQATNQFNGSAGALIQTPYADLNLGVTNGFLSVSNIMEASVPTWSGNIIAWNTRFLAVDTNGVTNDFRVLIVSSHLSPTLYAQVQNLILHGTNSIVISDTFNVMGSFSADAQSLTITTNPLANGATSLEGELNLNNPSILFNASMPNIRFLTNNGAIRTGNLLYFGYPMLTNRLGPVPATGLLSEIGTNVVKKDKVTIGTNQYLFVTALTNSIANQVAIVPSSFDASLSNLIAAINGAPGAGVAYSSVTKSNPVVVAGVLTNSGFTVTAVTPGLSGNSIVTTFSPAITSTNLSWNGRTTLSGGMLAQTNVVSFLNGTALVNNGVFEDQGAIIYAGNFVSSDVFSNGIGNFTLQSLTTTLTNGYLQAGGDVSITGDSIVTSNLLLQASRSLTLSATNLITDGGLTNGNVWSIGTNSLGNGFSLLNKPATGDLLGTKVTMYAPLSRTVASVWAGADRGATPAGYLNNVAIGQLTLDIPYSSIPGHNGVFTFSGTGASNALYVDQLILKDYATQGNATNSYNFPWLRINTNMVIYFADALEGGVSVAESIDRESRQGGNNGRLRWVYSYAGYFTGTNIITTNADLTTTTNSVNAALAKSPTIDSDSDGRPNSVDPTPFFQPADVNLTVTTTNLPPLAARVQWTTIPNATNCIYYSTNMLGTNWLVFTNFNNWYYGYNVARTNSTHSNGFISPQVYVNNASLPDNSQRTNVWIFDTMTNMPHYYKVVVWPWLNFPE